MAVKTLSLWLLLAWTVGLLSLGSCQHWSFGLSPGGKRELDVSPDRLDSIFEGLAHMAAPCSVPGCAEESPFAKFHRLKGLLVRVHEREHGHQALKQ
ncbi:progonadoliberin-1 [Fundulus heteroclitus]|uniref:progonadoliberin-1 n=1 Tax=Fundulus heteroclitus TaxID=8078 RepID=UPI00165A6FC8|nr:progonadoliberin-1 [Fundulus heteroclitus]